MPETIARIAAFETTLFEALDEAETAGLDDTAGRDAFRRAMTALDGAVECRSEQLYTPLAADPLTRDYVSHLDAQLCDLSARIDILRAHIELGLETGCDDQTLMNASLARLTSQLKVRSSRESALTPAYFSWCDRHAASAASA